VTEVNAARPLSLSVVVPTRNRQGFVRELIAAILKGTHVPAEIVVVDQSDTPDVELASIPTERGCAVVHHPSPTRGSSAARNEGIRAARNDVLAFVDDDVLPAPTWLVSLVSTLTAAGDQAVVTGQVRAGEPEASGGFAPSLKPAEHVAVYRGRAAANVLWTNNMVMFRAAVDDIGFFDERLGAGNKRFPGGEDNDFCFRLLEAGYRIEYQPEAVVFHRAWRPKRDYLGLRWRYGRGQGAFYGKHLRLRDPYILHQLGQHLVGSCGEVVRNVRRDPRLAAGSAANAAGALTATVDWVVSERLFGRSQRDNGEPSRTDEQ
jgi:GT2 family glycosyltransferase